MQHNDLLHTLPKYYHSEAKPSMTSYSHNVSVMRTFKMIYSQQLSNIHNSVVNYSHYGAHYTPRTYSSYWSYNWKIVPFDHIHPKSYRLTPIRMALFQNTRDNEDWPGCGGKEPSCTLVCVLSCDLLFATPWSIARQAPLSTGYNTTILARVAISFSRGSSWPRDQACISCVCCVGRWILHH